MTLLEHVAELNEDIDEIMRLSKEQVYSQFLDGNIDDAGIAAFRAVNSMMIHVSETMKQEAALLVSIDYKLRGIGQNYTNVG